jgi:hypothetical protein
LEQPTVSVRITERGKRAIVSMFRIRASRPSLGAGVVEHPAHIVENLPHFNASTEELGAGRLDVHNDEV